ncbi:hypothetical protein [Jannaschia pohangensis]|uniref:Uncharacterized protein n=1 Tax=Jannaschia pohangensis TaxID=390807 RepID=A0A1I3SGJ8_9RHOB|nr:hypothetical protein [Jannaschia pohangensis]SFJ56596.1 hypothetical protein SAMN04488095_3107 [Jannaschia pohangensis]
MMRWIALGAAAALLLGVGFGAGRLVGGAGGLAQELRIADPVLFADDRMIAGQGMRAYANYRAAQARGEISDAWTRGASDFETAEAMPASEAIALIGQYPAAENALYALFRSLEAASRDDLSTGAARRSLLFSVELAEGAKYMALTTGDATAFFLAEQAERCVLNAFGDGTLDEVARVCVPDLARALEPILGFRPETGARERGEWAPPGTPGD